MPIYVYECSSCEERFEYTQSIHEPPKTVCETCGGKLEKVIVPIAFHLKGGGWYKDLYSSQKSEKSAKPGKGDETVSSKSAEESKSDSKDKKDKSETKSETKKADTPKSSGGDK